MKWKKIGRIFDPAQLESMGLSSALMPTVDIINEDKGIIRVFFSPRNAQNNSVTLSFDMCIYNHQEIFNLSDEILLFPGKVGTFDDAGITLGSLVYAEDKIRLYYTGWNLTQSVPFNNSIGVAELKEGRFVRYGDGPVMTRTLKEPYSCASPFVMYENGVFKMWYASMDQWKEVEDGVRHYYNIKYAVSDDGLDWTRKCETVIDYADEGEYAFGRPFVLKEDGVYKMWYSYRGDYYKIGYAESSDGIQWERLDHLSGISVSTIGWDSEMIEYPCIFDMSGERYMLYNGNGYGKTGIGLAKLIGC